LLVFTRNTLLCHRASGWSPRNSASRYGCFEPFAYTPRRKRACTGTSLRWSSSRFCPSGRRRCRDPKIGLRPTGGPLSALAGCRSRRRTRLREPGPLVAQSEQRHDTGDVGFPTNRHADPPRFRMRMVRHRAALSHELLADAHWKSDISEVAAVHVPELAAPGVELDEP